VCVVKRALAVVSRNLRSLLAVAVLVVPLAVVAPGYLRGEVRRASGDQSVSAPPFGVPWSRDDAALTAGVVAHVPSHASLATIGAHVGKDSTRWIAYVIAPRLLTTGRARWAIVFRETPQHAHLHAARAWRYGRDWLVER
jgi:hypothetical protein